MAKINETKTQTIEQIKNDVVHIHITGFGNGGVNIIRWLELMLSKKKDFVEDSVSFLAVETDGPKLFKTIEDRPAIKALVLSEENKRARGTAGNTDRGRELAMRKSKEIEEVACTLAEKEGVALVAVTLGGGSCGAAPVFVKALTDKNVTVIVLAVLPPVEEGPVRSRDAQKVLQQLLDAKAAVVCMYNESASNIAGTVEEGFDYINRTSLVPIMNMLRVVFQQSGSERNNDGGDLVRVMAPGSCNYVNMYAPDKLEQAMTFDEETTAVIVKSLLSHELQDPQLVAKTFRAIVWAQGKWERRLLRNVVLQVKSKMLPSEDLWIKLASNSRTADPEDCWLGFISSAQSAEYKVPVDPVEIVAGTATVPAAKAVPPPPIAAAPSNMQKVELHMIDGSGRYVMKPVRIPSVLALLWEDVLKRGKTLTADQIESLKKQTQPYVAQNPELAGLTVTMQPVVEDRLRKSATNGLAVQQAQA